MNKEKDRFDLEREIMHAWNIVDDLQCLLDRWDSFTEDKKMNILIGLVDLYNVKFDTMFATFEECLRKKEFSDGDRRFVHAV